MGIERKAFLLISFFFVLAFSFYAAKFKFELQYQGSDALMYYHTAIAILDSDHNFNGRTSTELITFYVFPAYSFLLSGFMLLFRDTFPAMIVFQVTLTYISMFFLYLIIREYFSWFWSFLFVCLYILYYPLMTLNFHLILESISSFLLILITFCFQQYHLYCKKKHLIALVLLFILLIFINNRFIFHGIILFALMLLYLLKKNRSHVHILFCGAAFFLSVMIPWHIYEYSVYRYPVIFTPHKSKYLTKRYANADAVKRLFQSPEILTYEEYNVSLQSQTTSEKRKQALKKQFTPQFFQQVMEKHLREGHGIRKYWSRLRSFFTFYRSKPYFLSGSDHRLFPMFSPNLHLVNLALLLPFILLSGIGALFTVKNRDVIMMFVLVMILSHIAEHTITHYNDRYRALIFSLYVILGVYGVYNLHRILSSVRALKGNSLSINRISGEEVGL